MRLILLVLRALSVVILKVIRRPWSRSLRLIVRTRLDRRSAWKGLFHLNFSKELEKCLEGVRNFIRSGHFTSERSRLPLPRSYRIAHCSTESLELLSSVRSLSNIQLNLENNCSSSSWVVFMSSQSPWIISKRNEKSARSNSKLTFVVGEIILN